MKSDYGDEAVARARDGTGSVAEKRCAIVGITPVASDEQAEQFKCPVGTILYTVEFGDGTDALVPEADLRPVG
jgi:hypothetical protein